MPIPYISGGGKGKITQTAGTRVQLLVGGEGGFFTHLVNMSYIIPGTTAHTGTVMRSPAQTGSHTTVVGAMAAACTAMPALIQLQDSDGNNAAASDLIAIKLDNGDWHLSNMSAYSTGTFIGTLSTAIPTGRSVADGAAIICYGAAGDTFHARYQFALASSATTTLPAVAGEAISLVKNTTRGEPLIIDSDNATTAGTLSYANWALSVL